MKNKILDVLLFISVYFLFYFIKTGSINLIGSYSVFVIYYSIFSLFISIYYEEDLSSFQELNVWSLQKLLITILGLSLVVSLNNLTDISRLFILSITCTSSFLQWFFQYYRMSKTPSKPKVDKFNAINLSYFNIAISFTLLMLSVLIINFTKAGSLIFYPWFEQIILIQIFLWTLSSLLTNKFHINHYQNIYYSIAPFIKSHILMLLIGSAIFYFLKLDFISRELFFGSIIGFSLIETNIFLFIFIKDRARKSPIINDKENGDEYDQIDYNVVKKQNLEGNIIKLPNLLIPELNVLTNHVYKQIGFKYDEGSVTYLNTRKDKNFLPMRDKSQSIIINLELINNYLSINQCLHSMHNKIREGGILIGSYTSLDMDYQFMRNKMPKILFIVIYPIHFILFRVIPKLPITGILYDFLSRGKGRFISKAEVLGRLSYCGFKLIDSININHRSYFIAQSVRTISNKENPSFGPLVKLERIGFQKQVIHIFKFRTMHPYSEFIQEDVFEKNNLDATGKIRDDFRITAWGKILRKLWIDELPQIYNWIKGDVKLVGVRALSKHYFSLYPLKLQKLRVEMKPGLVPPYYADLPKNFDQILKSEFRYIEEKKKNRVITDLLYFVRAINNIILRGARSQ